MDAGDWVLLGIGSFVAVTALVRLMLRRRAQLVAELSMQIENEQRLAKQQAKSREDAGSEPNAARN